MRYIHRNDVYTTLRYLGVIMMAIGVMNLIPIIIDLIYLEFNFARYLVGGGLSICLGYTLYSGLKSRSGDIKLKHAMLISSLAWLYAAVSGAVIISDCLNLEFLSGVLENMSALTGTGATIFSDVEILPRSILFFRSLEQWIGGLGVVVMLIVILTGPGSASSKLYQSESREERLKPSIKNTLKKTMEIYLIYTILGIILLFLAEMPLFDSICTCFTTISTGGMGIKNANIGYYNNDLIYLVSMFLMILGAASFMVHYKIIKTKGKSLINDIQFKILISVIAIICIILYLLTNIYPMDILFTTVSTMTTCGATIVSTDTMLGWPKFVMLIMMCLMIIGGSSGSTVGAIKLHRIILFFKSLYRRVREILSPEGRVLPIQFNGVRITDKNVSDASNYIALYVLFLIFAWAVFLYFGYDPFNSLFDVVSLQGNVGFEVGIITYNMEPILKIVCIFLMWIGRLEIYPVLILFRSFFEVFKR